MKINKVIISSTVDKNYLDFWPIVKKAWESLDIEPILFLVTKKDIPDLDCNTFHIDKINDVFTAQNLRLLVPSLYPDDVCMISDIDMMPLSKKYFLDSINNIKNDKFVIFRSDATPESMLPICWNSALGSTWGKIFSVNDIDEIKNTLIQWYPEKYKPFKKNWYLDQIQLRNHINNYEKKESKNVIYFTDEELNFKRLNRDTIDDDLASFKINPEPFVDFHMPRPYSKNKELINEVFELNFF